MDPEQMGFAEIFREKVIYQIKSIYVITEGNISPNPRRGGSINDILCRKTKNYFNFSVRFIKIVPFQDNTRVSRVLQ